MCFFFFLGGGGDGGGGREGAVQLKPKHHARLSNEVKYKNATINTMKSMWYN